MGRRKRPDGGSRRPARLSRGAAGPSPTGVATRRGRPAGGRRRSSVAVTVAVEPPPPESATAGLAGAAGVVVPVAVVAGVGRGLGAGGGRDVSSGHVDAGVDDDERRLDPLTDPARQPTGKGRQRGQHRPGQQQGHHQPPPASTSPGGHRHRPGWPASTGRPRDPAVRRRVPARGAQEDGEGGGRRGAGRRVLGHGLGAGGDQEGRRRGGDPGEGGGVGVHVGHGQGDVGGGLERAPAGEQLVEDHPEGVDVGGRGGRVAEDAFGGQVGGGAEQVAGGEGGLAGRRGDAEVEHLDLAVRGQEHVARLDVAVDDPGPVGRLQGVGDRGHDPDRLRPGPWPRRGRSARPGSRPRAAP